MRPARRVDAVLIADSTIDELSGHLAVPDLSDLDVNCEVAPFDQAESRSGARLDAPGSRVPELRRTAPRWQAGPVVLEELLSQGSGHIVNISASVADQPIASAPSGLASLTKSGVSALTKSLAIEFARRGVRVNAVAPGITRTPLHGPATYEGLAKLVPEGRLGEVKDVVEAVLYLESAPFVTGEILHVDGGTAAGVA
jgi:NAD(P)-dependent dehydrogenase (short-subunit alcohol dehydrogenase family)